MCTMGSIYHLCVTLVFPVDIFFQFFMVLFMWIAERDNGQNYLKIAVIVLFIIQLL